MLLFFRSFLEAKVHFCPPRCLSFADNWLRLQRYVVVLNANPVSANDAKLEGYVSCVLLKISTRFQIKNIRFSRHFSRPDPGIRYSSFISTGSSLVPRPIRAIRVTRGGLEPNATSLTMTSHPKSPRTTWNEAEPAAQQVSSLRGRRNKGRGRGGEGRKGKGKGAHRLSFESHFKYLALSASV